jgi:hypothetical protein
MPPSPVPATAVPTDTSVPPTTAPTSAPTAVLTPTLPAGKAFEFNGVSFTYADALAANVQAKLVPTTTEDLPFLMVRGRHLEFTLVGYPIEFGQPHVQVFSLDAYLQQPDMSQVMLDQAQELRANLAQRPDLNGLYPLFQSPTGPVHTPPVIPPINAQIGVAARKGYLDFANGSGMRFVFWASQAPMYVDPNFLFYVYEGLSADGKHYVVVMAPVHASIGVTVPTPGANTTQAEIDAFNQDAANRIEAANLADFTPSLQALDALVQSLQIGDTAP